ncbi:MAG: hypothetical protein JOZ08_16650 [Verrucomicrobia bacterium]|nr:hypothetical protein [Verrucomicrobiota bacterium]MBV8278543.1 hypothetical protein [Verrucomicrobiota bacterium]
MATKPSPRNVEKQDLNREITGGNMDIFTLLIARTLRIPFTANTERTEKRPQAEPELPAIDFALLSKVTRENQQPKRSRETFAGTPVTAAM